MITLPFLAASTACERHGNTADSGGAAPHPAPSSPPASAASPSPVVPAGSATPAVTTPAATATPAATTPAATPSGSPSPEASAAGNSGASPSPTPVRLPHFASAEANEYVQSYEAYLQNFRTAYIRMMKDADLSGYGRLIAQAQELQARGEQIEEELDPSEREALGKYLDAKAEEIKRITSEAL